MMPSESRATDTGGYGGEISTCSKNKIYVCKNCYPTDKVTSHMNIFFKTRAMIGVIKPSRFLAMGHAGQDPKAPVNHVSTTLHGTLKKSLNQ